MLEVLATKEEILAIYNKKYVNQPEGTDEVVRLRDIKIPQAFAVTKPLDYKMKRCRERYRRLKYLDKPITIIVETNEFKHKNKLILVDEYSRYLYAKEIGLECVPVKYITIEEYCKERNI